MENPRIILKAGKEKSLLRFHPWIFSGAIRTINPEPKEGQLVDIFSSNGEFLAAGHYASGSIAVRILTFKQENIDSKFWDKKIQNAIDLRKRIGLIGNKNTNIFRLIHGEGDGLPGLIVDIYGDTAVLQCHSVGMYNSRKEIASAITRNFQNSIKAVFDKSSGTVPLREELLPNDEYLIDERNSQTTLIENGNEYLISWETGQKTGFFIDQRENRYLLEKYAKGKTVLNTFGYTGGFSVAALRGGAKRVVTVDSSASAIELATQNVKVNFGESAPHEGVVADAFEYLKRCNETFDVIVLDPPAFAKHNKALRNALQAYKRLNLSAIRLIKPGGLLFTFSCSQVVSKTDFRNAVFSACAISGRNASIIHQLTQPADHPFNIYHPEGEYLKGLILRIV